MGTLYEKYRAEINSWDWDGIVSEAQNNVQEADSMDGGDAYGTDFLGTVFSLAPSGKYYMPYACGNLDDCPLCHGKGTIKNKTGNQERYDAELGADSRMRLKAIEEYGPWSDGNWPETVVESLNIQEALVRSLRPERECPRCGGIGSYEAYQDQEFYQALDDVASDHGGWIESGEGDPCDIFFGVSVEVAEEDEKTEAE